MQSDRIEEDQMSIRIRMHRRGICVVIPTYNNDGTIENVVRRAMEQCDDVIVVDDGCTDNTKSVLSAIAGITVVRLPHNGGKGAALKCGFLKALELGFSYAITLDGDGQHYPEDIPLLVEASISHPGALIVGQRRGLDAVDCSGGSKFANAFSNFWFAVQTWQRLRDTQTGYRLYPLHRLLGLRFLTSRYEAELELLVLSAWHGVPLVTVEVNVHYPPREERVSHFRPMYDFCRITVLNTVLCCLALVYALPMAVVRCGATMLRSVYSLLFFLFFTLMVMLPAAGLVVAFVRKEDKKERLLRRLLCGMTRFLMLRHGIPGVRYSVCNPYKEKFCRPAVIICNHQSPLDLMPLLALDSNIVVVTNDRIWSNPFYGFVIRHAGFVPASWGMERMLSELRMRVEHGCSVAVYPEGTRSPEGKVGRFHKGAFCIARALGVDVLPIVLYGAGGVLPKNGIAMRRGDMRLEIDERVEASLLPPTDQAAASWFRKYYKSRYAEVSDCVAAYGGR